jgi:tellurite resistance protein
MRKAVIFVALLAVGMLSVSAQTATPRVTKRQVQQQARIKEGVKSGQLTPRETRKLERQQAKIAVDKAKAKADGVVTPAERRKLMREQNRASKRIYKEKHDAQVRK